MHAQFSEDVLRVMTGSVRADAESHGDSGVAPAVGEQCRDFQLTIGQSISRLQVERLKAARWMSIPGLTIRPLAEERALDPKLTHLIAQAGAQSPVAGDHGKAGPPHLRHPLAQEGIQSRAEMRGSEYIVSHDKPRDLRCLQTYIHRP